MICHATGTSTYARTSMYWELALTEHDTVHPGDIIPAFEYISGGKTERYAGQNWNAAGQAIFDNGCVKKDPDDPKPPTITDEPITPSVNCVSVNADGTFNAIFSYRNANSLPRTIAAGTDNRVDLDAAAAGSSVPGVPTEFVAGSIPVALTVSSIPEDGTATWVVTYGGTSRSAAASLATSPRCPEAESTPDFSVFATCITPNASGGFDALFGYQNNGLAAVSAPIGEGNYVRITGSATGLSVGQPSSLAPGLAVAAFTATSIPAGGSVSWAVTAGGQTRTATANSATERCAGPNKPPETPNEPIGLFPSCVSSNGNGTYNAVFGYSNVNPGAVEVAAGPANAVTFTPDLGDSESRGQPTVFMPGTTASAFVVRDIPATHEATWGVAYQGTTTATVGIAFPIKCLNTKGEPEPTPDPKDPTPPNPPVTPPPSTPPTAQSYQLGLFISCVSVRGGRYSATFGYANPGTQAFAIAAGAANRVTGVSAGGQPTTFLPGVNASAFTLSGLRLGATPTWTVTLPSGERVSATATSSADSCRTARRETPPRITTVIEPPKKPTKVGTPDDTTVRTRNNGTKTLYDVKITIPKFPNRSTPIKRTPAKGLTCKPVGSATVCTIKQLLPGQSTSVVLRTIPRAPGIVTGTTSSRGFSSTNQRVEAVDSGPLEAYGVLRTPVTG